MAEPQYIVRGGQLQVVENNRVVHTQKVQVNNNGDFVEIVVRPEEPGEVRIPVSELLSDGTFEPASFEASEMLADVTGNVGI